MATGDQADVLTRLKSALPRWFTDDTPVLDGILSGWAACWAYLYSFYAYARLQSRILTATDGWLDIIAADFFGSTVVRRENQTDTSFRATIIINLFRDRATRPAVITILTQLTGRSPVVIEPGRPADTGAYSAPNTGYGVNGGYGSLLHRDQAFITAYRPIGTGIPYVAGYGVSAGGYSTASRATYASLSDIQDQVTDADIYAAIHSVKVVGTKIWARITS